MPNNNLTDAEIKKALECEIECNKGLKKNCIGCLLRNRYPYCEEKVIEDALDLINRQEEQIATQQAEIEGLKELLKDWKKEAHKVADEKNELYCNCVELQAENEELNKDLADTIALNYEECKSLKAEIERLKTDIAIFLSTKKVLIPYTTDNGVEFKEFTPLYQKAKVEAYKEFAERVKIETGYLFSADSIEVEVNNILKKLVGEDK